MLQTTVNQLFPTPSPSFSGESADEVKRDHNHLAEQGLVEVTVQQ